MTNVQIIRMLCNIGFLISMFTGFNRSNKSLIYKKEYSDEKAKVSFRIVCAGYAMIVFSIPDLLYATNANKILRSMVLIPYTIEMLVQLITLEDYFRNKRR